MPGVGWVVSVLALEMFAVVADGCADGEQEASVADCSERLALGVLASVDVAVSALHKEDFHREYVR